MYYEAYFKNLEGKYEASNKTIQTLASKYANHKYWGVKGLLVMAQNNEGLNDAFQATYILENVIENYTQYEDLLEEAKAILEKIQQKEDKKNSTKDSPADTTETTAF